jgi:cytochrome c biogenesis protein CcmG, thiol:disulfide interchange protein DsbE
MNRKKLAFQLQLVAVLLSLALGVLIADSMRERIVETGDRAPRFAVTTDKGRQITPRDFGGKVLVLNFWATWCPPCIEELPSLETMAKQLGAEGVVVLGVSVDKNQQLYQDFLNRARVSFETARDPEASISSEYGTYKYPETYVIDKDGRVRQKYIGPRDWTEPAVMQSIRALL